MSDHVCGMQGFDPELGDVCSACCDQAAKAPEEPQCEKCEDEKMLPIRRWWCPVCGFEQGWKVLAHPEVEEPEEGT